MDARTNRLPDIRNVVSNADFYQWELANPVNWIVSGEVAEDPEVTQVGTGEGHGGMGTGCCNLYTSAGDMIAVNQSISLVKHRRYRYSIKVDTVIVGAVRWDDMTYATFAGVTYETGTFEGVFRALGDIIEIRTRRGVSGSENNVTVDDYTVKRLRQQVVL